jgi:DNA-binding HxlR family transcriptional regulator
MRRTDPMPELDKLIHERSRLLILTHLASHEKEAIPFGELQEKFSFTPGNLSIQLKKLQTAKYIKIKKTFRNNKPHTAVSITDRGIQAINVYLDEMEELIKSLRE